MIATAVLALLVAAVSLLMLLATRYLTAQIATVDMSPIAMFADEEHSAAGLALAEPLSEDGLACSRHRLLLEQECSTANNRLWQDIAAWRFPLIGWLPNKDPGCYQQPGLFYSPAMITPNSQTKKQFRT